VSTSSAALVRAAAVSSALLSAVTLLLSGRTGDPLPVQTINLSVISAGAAGMAVLLHSRTPETNLWRVLLVIAVAGPLAVAVFAVTRADSTPLAVPVGVLWLVDPLLVVPWMLFIGLFPDGHRPVRRWPQLVWGSALVTSVVSVTAALTAPAGSPYPVPGHLPGARVVPADGTLHAIAAYGASALTGLPLVAAWCLLLRYRRAGPVMQQQIRVGAAGLVTAVLIEVGLRTFPFVDDRLLQFAAAVVAVGVGALGVAAALLRWRLWIVDQALPRAVVLSSCSAAFTAVIVAGALIVTGQVRTSQVRVAVLAAAAVTILVQGYSRRLEPWVRRLVYGDRPGGFAVLIGLADDLAALDGPTAAVRIADSARRALAVPWAVFWAPTARQSVFRLAAVSGDLRAPLVIDLTQRDDPAPDGPATRLVPDDESPAPFPDETAALSLLGAGTDRWGLLAVGQRRGEPLTDGDIELLTVITREAELAHDNRQLLDEVAVSLEQLQTRARELQESRQRLVVAQDEERRRIERDLHDGAQHDLVTLAGQLRGLARSQTYQPGALEDLAERAERAVFSLQDLARGIYPSVLTDRGVAAAIRSYVGRLPLAVTLEAEGATARRRWSDDLEVALYFVAVESLGNCLKHAAATATTVTLAEQNGDVLLEVHDNGDGFDPHAAHAGSGLQHMSDRMAALGGTLVVSSRRAEGTWVTARVPACIR